MGMAALPHSCRQFPRILLADGRGWHLSLSAWCPTAARLIVTAEPTDPVTAELAVRSAPETFLSFTHIHADRRVHVEALDACQAWPPLLRPGVLAGLVGYDTWEQRVMSDWLAPAARGETTTGMALGGVIRWTEWIRGWRAADGDLTVRIAKRWTPGPVRSDGPNRGPAATTLDSLLIDLMGRVPSHWRPAQWPDGLTDASVGRHAIGRVEANAAIARYLAVRLTGSWLAYQGQGLRSVLASLVSSYALTCLALARTGDAPVTIGRLTSAIRAADWLQLHLLDREGWAAWCSASEQVGPERLLRIVADAAHELDRCAWTSSSSRPSGPVAG